MKTPGPGPWHTRKVMAVAVLSQGTEYGRGHQGNGNEKKQSEQVSNDAIHVLVLTKPVGLCALLLTVGLMLSTDKKRAHPRAGF